MAQKLYQTFEVPEIINEEEQLDKEYHRSMKWNPETGDFVRDEQRSRPCYRNHRYPCFRPA